MHLKTLLILILFVHYNLRSQNLVPNSSFEEFNSIAPCGWIEDPLTFDTTLVDWYKPSFATPDIYSLTVDVSCRSHCFSEPQDEARGWQAPRTGNSMIGVVTTGVSCNGLANLWKEYVSVKLSEPLEIGELYYAEMYVSHADFCVSFTNYLGMYFSEDSIIELDNCSVLNVEPQVLETSIIYEQEDWYKISGTFTVEFEHNYLTIGNFGLTPDLMSDLNPIFNSPIGYYFIDDVTVRKACQNTTETLNICQGEELTLSSEINEFVGWANSDNPTEIISTEEILNVSPNDDITYFAYTVCDTATIQVQVNPTANFSLGNDTVLCPGDALQFNAPTTATAFEWSDGSQANIFEVITEGIYWIDMEDDCGMYSDTIEIKLLEPLSIDLGDDVSLCFQDTLTLNAYAPNANYLWQDGSTDSILTVVEEGIYSVSVEDNCTFSSDEIAVTFNPEIITDLPLNLELCASDSVLLSPNVSGASFVWQDGSTNQNFLVTEAGLYSVEVNQNGCLKTDSVLVEEDACEVILDMPNVFSPNGDGYNDVFKPMNLNQFTEGSLNIFNRWGGRIFSSKSLASGWDGNCEGHTCNSGIYYWVIDYIDINGNQISLRGDLTLIN